MTSHAGRAHPVLGRTQARGHARLPQWNTSAPGRRRHRHRRALRADVTRRRERKRGRAARAAAPSPSEGRCSAG